jgi:biopolymer transport protein ExbB
MNFFASFLHFFEAGGAFMYPIAVVGICAIAITIERWLFLTRVGRENSKLWSEVSPLIAQGDVDGADRVTQGSDTAIARILGNGLAQARVDNKRSELEVATEEGLMEVLPAIEKRTHYLGTFSNMSTLLGLLGTVLGLIGSFAALGSADPAEKADLLSKGISEAMNCTAFGLMVAIPSLLMHSYLQAKTTELVDALEAACGKFVNVLSNRAPRR